MLADLPNFGICLIRHDPADATSWQTLELRQDYAIHGRNEDRKPVVLAANGGRYAETQQIQRLAVQNEHEPDGSYGHYDLSDTGTYTIRGYFFDTTRHHTVSAREIQFTVR